MTVGYSIKFIYLQHLKKPKMFDIFYYDKLMNNLNHNMKLNERKIYLQTNFTHHKISWTQTCYCKN